MVKMDLLLCKNCFDVVQLTGTIKSCHCGAIWGFYKDEFFKEVSSNALILNLSDKRLIEAISRFDGSREEGLIFRILPDTWETVTRNELTFNERVIDSET